MGKATGGLGLLRGRFPHCAVFVLVPLLALVGGAGCSGDGDDAAPPSAIDVNDAGGIEGDAQADGDANGDLDADADAGTDGHTEEDADVGDADVESDAGIDADADTDGDADTDADTGPTLARIEVIPDATSVVERRTVQLAAKGYGEDEEENDVDVTWSSSDEALATVDGEGLVTTWRPGTVTITASADGTSDVATITITESLVATITLEADATDVPLDGQVQLRAIVEDADGHELLGRTVSFESEDESIVTVTADGTATGVEVGEATIKAKLGAIESSLDVRVVLRFAELVARNRNTCGLTAGGRAWCWGDNNYGQVGIGDRGSDPYRAPQRVHVESDVSFDTVAVGAWHICALSTTKEVWCWGSNGDEALGYPYPSVMWETKPRLAPDRTYERLGAQGYGVCGLDAGGFAHCWGSGSIYYELGHPDVTDDTPTPVAVSAPEGESSPIAFVELRHGDYFSCGLTGTGSLYCWGRNTDHRLGDGTTVHRARSVRPLGDAVVKRFALGLGFACAVTDDDTTHCWGANAHGQADPSAAGSSVGTPTVRFEATDFVPASFAFGADHACALDRDGRAYCWGSNALHQLGRSTSDGPADKGEVEGGLRFTQLAAGNNHVCGLATDGKAYCWGENKYGQLGTGDLVDKPQPTPVAEQ